MKKSAKSMLDEPGIDYRSAFINSPVATIISTNRVIVDCNNLALSLFRADRDSLVNQSFKALYPTQKDFEKTGKRLAPLLAKTGSYSDSLIMRRMDNELFWCTIIGFCYDRAKPYAHTLWSFFDLSSKPAPNSAVSASLTNREREVATMLVDGHTSKEIGKALSISPRTVDVYRSNLFRKYSVKTTTDLVRMLLV